MALFQSSSFFNPLLSSSNNQNTANFRPKTAQISTVRAVPLCVSSTSLPVTPILKLDHHSSDYAHLFPSLPFSNILFFKSAYNVQVVAGEHEPEEKLIGRFRREVFRAGVIQESKRRRFFESTQEKKKRKCRDAARRNRKRFVSIFLLFLIYCFIP